MFSNKENLKGIKSFAILGGTFDPIHNGHTSVAKEILKRTDAQKVIFVPTGLPPHKELSGVTKARTRLEMTNICVEKELDMVTSAIEVEREGMTYTVDTVRQLRQCLGSEVKFKFITGADAMHYISSWKDYKELLEICSFIVVTRPGYNKDILLKDIQTMQNIAKCDIEFIEIEPVDVSSSQIRSLVKKGESIENLVSKEVEEYILSQNLYKEGEETC